jgi:DMSO/TMAO reductase YedYZ heme-binding membrane subunit
VTTWIVLRAAGIGAYVLLFLSVAWGLVGTTSLFGPRVAKATAVTVHQFLSVAALLLLGVHIGGLLLDSFMPFHPLDVLLPLHTTFRPVATALGVLAMYGMVIVLASSWLRRRVGPTWWRRLHLLAAPAFGLSMVHGIFAGTDSARPWMWWLYVGTGLTVLFLVIVRGLTAGQRPERHELAPGTRARPARAARVPSPAATEPVERAG